MVNMLQECIIVHKIKGLLVVKDHGLAVAFSAYPNFTFRDLSGLCLSLVP
jgi:hypothetical protein